MNTAADTPERFLRVSSVAERCGVSAATVWNWCNPKSRHFRLDFPKPVKISGRVTAWREQSINRYIRQLEEQGNGQAV